MKPSDRSALIKVAVAAGVFAILVPSIASAGGGGGGGPAPVRVTNQPTVRLGGQPTVQVKDAQGEKLNVENTPNNGVFNAPGWNGSVRNRPIIGAFLGYMDNLDATAAPNQITIPAAAGQSELHRLIVMESANFPNGSPNTVNCEIEISTDAVTVPGTDPPVPAPLLEAVFTEPTVLESPLHLTDDFHIKVRGPDGAANTNCAVGVIGYVPTSAFSG